jgi:hypothetical protein
MIVENGLVCIEENFRGFIKTKLNKDFIQENGFVLKTRKVKCVMTEEICQGLLLWGGKKKKSDFFATFKSQPVWLEYVRLP